MAVSRARWHLLGRSSNAASRANIGFGCLASLTHENLRLRPLRLSERLEPNRPEPASYWLKRVRDKSKSGAGFACATPTFATNLPEADTALCLTCSTCRRMRIFQTRQDRWR